MATCKSCDAPIQWAFTPTGKRIPLDPGFKRDGNLIVDDDGVARVVEVGTGERMSHFATCPNARTHRRKGS